MILHQDLIAYADDTVVPIVGKTWSELEERTTLKLNNIYSWLYRNKLILNVAKSVYITFGNYRDSVPDVVEIQINNSTLNRETNTKYLGVTFDYKIKWDVHINNIVKKTKYLVYVFYRLRSILSRKQLLQIYYGLFHSTALYGIIGWGGLYDTSLGPLQRLQNHLLKIIDVGEQDPRRPLNIKQAFVLKSLFYQYKTLKKKFNLNTINTRHKSIQLPRNLLTIGQRSFAYYAIKYYNALPMDLKCLDVSAEVLKHKLKSVIKNFTNL